MQQATKNRSIEDKKSRGPPVEPIISFFFFNDHLQPSLAWHGKN